MCHVTNVRTYTTKGRENVPNPEWGKTSIIEGGQDLPFEIKRIFYCYSCHPETTRGGHRHKKAVQALVSIHGGWKIYVNDGKEKREILLDTPEKTMIVEPTDWHTMTPLTKDAILLVASSEHYDVDDYIDEKYPND